MVSISPPLLTPATIARPCFTLQTLLLSSRVRATGRRCCGVLSLVRPCRARRRVRYEDDDEDDEEYGNNEEFQILEAYSETTRSEALLVHATVDDQEEEVLVFRGFSSCLSGRTAPDPSKSVLPAKAVIQSVDVVRGPFDPSNIEYLEKGLTWEAFKTRLRTR
ncbi:hypothetical protein J5N97_006782 [Dioscorea zingiberensis]|uniref:DUF7734 domain-containing protein n=1 Tax=Dioscorea zingiberensis TaxID=325984 RepID=A0A9D5HTW2_9LILI|nr:hypothetical protein J5N97_006782 [Dioscorea zingiberensis]